MVNVTFRRLDPPVLAGEALRREHRFGCRWLLRGSLDPNRRGGGDQAQTEQGGREESTCGHCSMVTGRARPDIRDPPILDGEHGGRVVGVLVAPGATRTPRTILGLPPNSRVNLRQGTHVDPRSIAVLWRTR